MSVLVVLAALGVYAAPEDLFERHADIAYRTGKGADPLHHRLDVYVPVGKKDFPVVLFVHGGSWRSGNKNLYAVLGRSLAADGLGCVICNYRLTPKALHPAHIEDVAKAFAWTSANIGKYGGRKDQLFLCGHSAGGQLVSLLATDPQYLKAEGLTPSAICAVCSISGVYRIDPTDTVFAAPFGKDPEVCKAASPITHAAGKHPPFMIAYAENELQQLDEMAVDMIAALKSGGTSVEVMTCKHRNHISIITRFASHTDPLNKAFRTFVQKQCK